MIDKAAEQVILEARCKHCGKKLATNVTRAQIVCPRCGVFNSFPR